MSLRVKKWKYMRKANSIQGNYCLFFSNLCKVAGNNFHKKHPCSYHVNHRDQIFERFLARSVTGIHLTLLVYEQVHLPHHKQTCHFLLQVPSSLVLYRSPGGFLLYMLFFVRWNYSKNSNKNVMYRS